MKFAVADQSTESYDYQFQISLRHSKHDDCWHVGVRVEFHGKNGAIVNYSGRIEYEGLFDIHPDFDQARIEDLVRMNGGAILYGAIREYVLGMTARSKRGPFELPTIDARMFLQVFEPAVAESSPAKS